MRGCIPHEPLRHASRLCVKLKRYRLRATSSTLGDYIVVQFDGNGVNALPDAKKPQMHHINGWKTSGTGLRSDVQYLPENQEIDLAPSAHVTSSIRARVRERSRLKPAKYRMRSVQDGFKIDSSFYIPIAS